MCSLLAINIPTLKRFLLLTEVHDYNVGMSGIDCTGQMLSYHSALPKFLRWYKKAGIRFFEKFLINTFYLYNWTKALSSENININIFNQKIAATLVRPQFPDPEHQALPDFYYLVKLPLSEK